MEAAEPGTNILSKIYHRTVYFVLKPLMYSVNLQLYQQITDQTH